MEEPEILVVNIQDFTNAFSRVHFWQWFLHKIHCEKRSIMLAANAATAESFGLFVNLPFGRWFADFLQQKPSRVESVYEAHKFGSTGYLFNLLHCLFDFDFRTEKPGFERLQSRLKSIGCFFPRQMSRKHTSKGLLEINIQMMFLQFLTC